MPRRDETKELLADPEFRRHLERIKAGKVKYVELTPSKPEVKRAAELKAAIKREGFGSNVDWSAVERGLNGRKRGHRKKIKGMRVPIFGPEGYQLELKTLNGDPLPNLAKMVAKPLGRKRR